MTPTDERLLALRAEGLGWKAIGTHLGWSRDRVRRRYEKLVRADHEQDRPPSAAGTPPKEVPVVTMESGDTAVVESSPTARITTLEQLLAFAKVDLAVWDVERYVVNKWEVGAKIADGDGVKAMAVEPLIQVKAWLRRIAPASMLALRQALVADVEAISATRHIVRAVAPMPIPKAERHMLEVCLMDLHLGKLAWAEETGHDYDIHIAERLARTAVEDLLAQAAPYPLDRILLPIGNDYFHVDGYTGLTTAGTPQDRDSRYQKMVRVGHALAVWMVEKCAEVAPVAVVIVPGNHDRTTTFHLGEVLAAEFKHDPRVTVDNSAAPRKYQRYGANLLGFTHGDEEPHQDLPLTMATERPLDWAETRFREWHLGHLHTSKRTDTKAVAGKQGVRTRILQSLSGVDAWHTRKAYVGEPGGAEAFVWRFTGGLRANLFTHPAADAYKAA